MIFEKGLQGVCGCGGFRDKVDRLHQGPDAGVFLCIDHVFAAYYADDVINIVFVDRQAREGNGRMFCKDFFEGELVIESGYDLAGSFEFSYRDIVKGEGVGYHITLVICEGTFLGAFFREEDDFIIIIFLGFFDRMDEELDGLFADKGNWAHEDANEVHWVDEWTEELAAIEDSNVFG